MSTLGIPVPPLLVFLSPCMHRWRSPSEIAACDCCVSAIFSEPVYAQLLSNTFFVVCSYKSSMVCAMERVDTQQLLLS